MSERDSRLNPGNLDVEYLQLADVAQQYFLDDMTQEQIARRLGVSRSNVSRMLKEARERGLVEIRVHHPLRTSLALQEAIVAALPLHTCLVLATDADTERPSLLQNGTAAEGRVTTLGALAARYLNEQIGMDAVVGVGWGSTVYSVVTSGYIERKLDTAVVQLMGSMGGATPDIDGGQVASRLGRALGAKVYYLHAPMVVTDASVRAGLMRDQHIRQTLDMVRRADVLVFSVGAVSRASGLYRAGYLTDLDLEYIQSQGAVGDICGAYFRQDGSPCPLELEQRTVAASAETMRAAPLRVGVGWGAAKALPSIGAIRAGLINVLVTEEECAREMLALLQRERANAPGESDAAVPQTPKL